MSAQSWKVGEFVHGVDYYELLGVDRSASESEIKSAYRSLARSMHPDMGGTSGTFRLLQEAYETLNDPVRRAHYDNRAQNNTAPAPPASARHTAPRPGSRARSRPEERASRLRDFGDDPEFAPGLPDLTPDDIPWWAAIDPAERVRYVPVTGPEPAPTLGMLGGWVLFFAAGLAVELASLLLALWWTVVVVAGIVVLLLLRRYVGARRTDRLFALEFRGRRVFGQPEAGRDERAQQLTATLLSDYLTRLPGVRIFHGVAWPDSVFADVDHAVLCGRRLVLIESKRWLPGHYTADDEGVLWRNGHRFRGGATRLPEGIAAFEDVLPDVEVRGALLVYPSRAGEVTTGETSTVAAAPLTPDQFVREIGDWLSADPATVDRDVFRVVLDQTVSHQG